MKKRADLVNVAKNQGANEVYSYLSTQPGWMHDNEAKISICRLATLEGDFIEKGNNEFKFTL